MLCVVRSGFHFICYIDASLFLVRVFLSNASAGTHIKPHIHSELCRAISTLIYTLRFYTDISWQKHLTSSLFFHHLLLLSLYLLLLCTYELYNIGGIFRYCADEPMEYINGISCVVVGDRHKPELKIQFKDENRTVTTNNTWKFQLNKKKMTSRYCMWIIKKTYKTSLILHFIKRKKKFNSFSRVINSLIFVIAVQSRFFFLFEISTVRINIESKNAQPHFNWINESNKKQKEKFKRE